MTSIDKQISEVKREIALRKQLYPGWVRARKLDQEKATKQLNEMEAVLGTLEAYKTLQNYLINNFPKNFLGQESIAVNTIAIIERAKRHVEKEGW